MYKHNWIRLAAVNISVGHDPAGKHKRHPSVDRQNEGIEDATELWMILLDVRGLLPRDERGIRLAVIKKEDVTFAVPIFTQSPHISV